MNFYNQNCDQAYNFNKTYFEDTASECFDELLLARDLFDLREFKKCSNLLKDFIQNPENQQAIFFYYYSLFMAGEIRKEEEMYENDSQSKTISNQEIPTIFRDLGKFYS